VGRVLLFVGLAPLLAIALYVAVWQRSTLSQTATDNLANHALLEAAGIERLLNDAAGDIEALAANPVLEAPGAPAEQKSKQLRQAQDFFEVFEDITLIDLQGNVTDSTTYLYYGNWAEKTSFKEALGGRSTVSDVNVIPGPNRFVMVFATPVISEGEIVAVVAGQMNMDEVWAILDGVKIGNTGFLAALDGNGNIISHPDKAFLFTKLGGELEWDGSQTATISVSSGQGGKDLTGQAAPVNFVDWQVVALQDRAEALALVSDALTTVAIAAAVVAAATVVLSVVSSAGIARPVRALAGGMARIAAGDLRHRVPPVALDEIDDLATSFNAMATGLEESTQQLKEANEELESRYRELVDARHQAATDGLTGIYNHRTLQDALTREVERSVRYGHPLALLMMDVDGFKLFNDTYGHQAGDGVLRQVAGVLTKMMRTGDFIGRYGGDEFMAILPHTDRDGATSMAKRTLEAFSLEKLHTDTGDDLPLVVSIGVAVCPDDSQHKQELLACADASLYEAKQASGSSLRVARQEPDEMVAYQDTPLKVLDSLVRGIDSKDSYTRQHSQQDADLAAELGDALGLSQEPLRALRVAGLLHDVGKIGVPDDILKKPGPLTDEERRTMQEHVVLGKLIIQGVPNLQDVVEAVYTHHERWDGTGYPQGLKGEEIPLLGRVLAVADAYSAMILDRPYRKALSHEQAVEELRRGAGTQLDPELVEQLIDLLERRREAAA
jgi:diguanylate cyclase (GGDEF)-like protein/putative nucleotidyltransferase with HDIG domain